MTNLLLMAGASAALHKGADLASKLSQNGFSVRVVLTPRAAQLIAPQAFEALTGEPAWVDEFGPARRAAMDHIDLADWAQALLVAPCTADLLSRLALGLAGDLAGTVALALGQEVPRFLAPAMNPRMWSAPALQRHVATLRGDGWRLLEPESGHMACGDDGPGRMPEPARIVAELSAALR